MALTLRFLIASFSKILPWSTCKSEWGSECLEYEDGVNNVTTTEMTKKMSPAELYFQ